MMPDLFLLPPEIISLVILNLDWEDITDLQMVCDAHVCSISNVSLMQLSVADPRIFS